MNNPVLKYLHYYIVLLLYKHYREEQDMSTTKKVHLKRYNRKQNKESEDSVGISYWNFLTNDEVCENRININIKHRI